MRRMLVVVLVGSIVAAAYVGWADNLVFQVPDWNQPSAYGVGGYPNWCSPTAGGNVMGYWEDVMGFAGLADRQAEPLGPGYPNNPGTWQQGLYHDGMIEMGWFMDTGSWTSAPVVYPPAAGGTGASLIAPGVMTYASTAWVDPGAAAIQKVAHPNVLVTTDTRSAGPPPVNVNTMWPTYTAEIDAGRPVLCTFTTWVNWNQAGMVPVNINVGGVPVTVETYPWDVNVGDHTVVGVGYVDLTPNVLGDLQNEWLIAQDGWQTTGQYVGVPLDQWWFQNDYVLMWESSGVIPEPAMLGLVGVALLAVRKRRK